MEQINVEIESERQYQEALTALGKRTRPSWLLRLIMNALERYRQSRKMGWSRPQNKLGLTIFASYECKPSCDAELVASAFEAARGEFARELGEAQRRFLDELAADPGLMAFLFVHDRKTAHATYEGATFSFGRRALRNPRFRDRFDLIVESEIGGEGSRGPSSVRAFIDPFRQPIADHPALALTHEHSRHALTAAANALFARAAQLHREWSLLSERRWSHWTSEYIDYFGPRKQPVVNTFFPTHVDFLEAMARATRGSGQVPSVTAAPR